MDLNIEGQGEVVGWAPPLGETYSPGFKATMYSLYEAGTWLSESPYNTIQLTKRFIDKLEEKGYCIARYDNE